jgi:hypothetical protein
MENTEDKLKNLESQVRAVRLGLADAIECPYCGQWNREGASLCCNTYLRTMIAVCDRLDVTEALELTDRIFQTIR